MFSLVWVLGGENLGFASNSTFALWLQNQKYTLAQRNNYPSGIFAVGIVSTLCSAVYMSKIPRARHWHVSVFISLVMVIVAVLIRADPLNPKVVFSAQYLGGVAYAGQAVFFFVGKHYLSCRSSRTCYRSCFNEYVFRGR